MPLFMFMHVDVCDTFASLGGGSSGWFRAGSSHCVSVSTEHLNHTQAIDRCELHLADAMIMFNYTEVIPSLIEVCNGSIPYR